MMQVLLTLFQVGLVFGVGALILTPTIRAACTERASDLVSIKARYEGLIGLAGPNMKVVSIRRSGTQPAGRSNPPARVYEVALKRPDGSELKEVVGVSAGFFDNGNLVSVSGSKRRLQG